MWVWTGLGVHAGLLPSSSPREPALPQPWVSQFSLQALMICLPPFSREWNRVSKLANLFWKRQESKMAHRGGQPSIRPGLGTSPAPPCPHFLVKQDASHQCLASSSRDNSDLTRSDYYQVPYKPAPESTCHTSTPRRHNSEKKLQAEP